MIERRLAHNVSADPGSPVQKLSPVINVGKRYVTEGFPKLYAEEPSVARGRNLGSWPIASRQARITCPAQCRRNLQEPCHS